MNQYVLGFLFHGPDVALIYKLKGPRPVIDRWNGVGGKVELGESPFDAMVREFKEETGVTIEHWWSFCEFYMSDYQAMIACYMAKINGNQPRPQLQQLTEERVAWWPYRQISRLDVVPNLHWLIGLALDPERPQRILVPEIPRT